MVLLPVSRNAGTSPRVWGDSFLDVDDEASCRYIPTRVGRFAVDTQSISLRSVHPHACGAIALEILKDQPGSGTSPRVWGDWPG